MVIIATILGGKGGSLVLFVWRICSLCHQRAQLVGADGLNQ
jgi:hypothetical protein